MRGTGLALAAPLALAALLALAGCVAPGGGSDPARAPILAGAMMLAAPEAFIMVLGGLAMLRVLQGAFIASFAGKFTLGALVSMLVTVADIAVLNIGAAFWGLVAGFVVSWMMEKHDFVTLANRN